MQREREEFDRCSDDEPCLLDMTLVPNLSEAVVMHRRAPGHKAVSEDQCGPDLFAAAPNETAELLHPLYAKSFFVVRAPLQGRGGMLHTVFKGHGVC